MFSEFTVILIDDNEYSGLSEHSSFSSALADAQSIRTQFPDTETLKIEIHDRLSCVMDI